jgi:phosphoribosylanthranilate isomerase
MADPLIIKICGIKTSDILETVIEAGADMVGFMHFARSPRHASIEEIATLISEARGRIETCVVLVNPDNSCVAEVAALGPDWIQLHGPETPHRVEAIRADFGAAFVELTPQQRDSHHEELIEVRADDRQELETLEQRHARVLRFFEHAMVELEPRQLTVHVGVVGHHLFLDCSSLRLFFRPSF